MPLYRPSSSASEMIRVCAAIGTGISVFLFPWPMVAVLALAAALVEPLAPLAAGILLDTLYYVPLGFPMPFFTISGALVTGAAIFVQSRLRAGIMGR